VDENLILELMSLGFTEYEAKVYIFLLGKYPSTGYQVSKEAGIPRSMVYEALGRLSGRGAVLQVGEGRATHYRPLPPEILLDRHMHEQERRVLNLREYLRNIYVDKKEERLWSIKGEETILTYASRMIHKAESEVSLVLADEHLEILSGDICDAQERNVVISALLTGEGELGCGEVARHPPVESELQELTGMLVVVVDQDEALIASSTGELTATITNNPHLTLIARQFVWMELFAQRIYKQIGTEIMAKLSDEDQHILKSFAQED
jgi:sugar-specific transcriptional regulator TrmB